MKFVTKLVLLLVVANAFPSWAAAKANYNGTVRRAKLEVSGVPARLDKFWRRTSYPKTQKALVTLIGTGRAVSAKIGVSPSDPTQFRDLFALTGVQRRKYEGEGSLLADNDWKRDAKVVIKILPSGRMSFNIWESATNDSAGYEIRTLYKGILKKP